MVSRKQIGNKAGGVVSRNNNGVSRFANRAGTKGLRAGKNVDYNEEKSDNIVGSKRGVDGEILQHKTG